MDRWRAQYLTLVFIGCISVSSLRAFLRNMHQVRQACYVQLLLLLQFASGCGLVYQNIVGFYEEC